jgi:hypothetical protein
MSSTVAIPSSQQASFNQGTPIPANEWLAVVREKVEGLRYGVVQLVVHDGRVTQIDRTERTRLEQAGREA